MAGSLPPCVGVGHLSLPGHGDPVCLTIVGSRDGSLIVITDSTALSMPEFVTWKAYSERLLHLLQTSSAASFTFLRPASRAFYRALDIGGLSSEAIYDVSEQVWAFIEKLGDLRRRRQTSPAGQIEVIVSAAPLATQPGSMISSSGTPVHEKAEPHRRRPRSGFRFGLDRGSTLYKGNFLRTADAAVVKVCESPRARQAETKWMSLAPLARRSCRYFRPVESLAEERPPRSRAAVRMCRVNGVTAAELLWRVQCVGRAHSALIPKLEVFSSIVVSQALKALREFRSVGRAIPVGDGWRMTPYPWAVQLRRALLEVRDLARIDDHILRAACGEVEEIGRCLKPMQTEPFRDAHLKNRLIDLGEIETGGCQTFSNVVARTRSESWEDRLRGATWDIDFETGLWLVTPWDDVWHVLWSTTGLASNLRSTGGSCATRVLPDLGAIDHCGWSTLLCRSVRELCRRVWYSRVMPQTYARRYGKERCDIFLDLAIVAAENLADVPSMTELLATWRSLGGELWEGDGSNFPLEPVKVGLLADWK